MELKALNRSERGNTAAVQATGRRRESILVCLRGGKVVVFLSAVYISMATYFLLLHLQWSYGKLVKGKWAAAHSSLVPWAKLLSEPRPFTPAKATKLYELIKFFSPPSPIPQDCPVPAASFPRETVVETKGNGKMVDQLCLPWNETFCTQVLVKV